MTRFTRRQALAGLAALPVAARAGTAADPSLDALARAGGRRFGSAIAWNPRNRDSGSVQNPAYAALVRRECGIVVPENEMKWQWPRKSPEDRKSVVSGKSVAGRVTRGGCRNIKKKNTKIYTIDSTSN